MSLSEGSVPLMAVGGHRSFNLGLIWLAAPLRTDYALSTLLGSWRRITAKKSALATMKHTICSRSKYQMSLINHRTNSNYQIQILQQIRTTLLVPKKMTQEFFKASTTNQFFCSELQSQMIRVKFISG